MKEVIYMAFAVMFITVAQAQSDCSNPTIIHSLPFTSGNLTTCGAGDNFSRGSLCGSDLFGGGEDYVFSYFADTTATWQVTLGGSAVWKIVSVHTACPPTPSNCVDAVNTGAGTSITKNMTFEAGQQYFIYIDTWPPPTCGGFTLSILEIPAEPENNLCSTAIELDCEGETIQGTTKGTTEITSPGCGSKYGVWYTFTGNGFGTLLTSTAFGGYDHKMAIYRDSCDGLSLVACRDAAGQGGTESHQFMTVDGVQYFVYIAHSSPSSTITGDFSITRICIIPPPNNDCAGAILLADGEPGSGLGYFSQFVVNNNDPNDACDGPVNTTGGLWYKLITDRDGVIDEELTITVTPPPGMDIGLYIYEGDCDNLTLVDCSDGGIGGIAESVILENVGDSIVYYILVKRDRNALGLFSLSVVGSALPIELISFNAFASGSTNTITWKTAWERNNDVQIVERSADGRNNWHEIGRLSGQNKSNVTIYQLPDSQPLRKSYYRLRSVDFDGKASISHMVFVDRSDLISGGIRNLYPNPATNDITLHLENKQTRPYQIYIHDLAGRTMKVMEMVSTAGDDYINISLMEFNAGTYIMTITSDDYIEHKKIVKQ